MKLSQIGEFGLIDLLRKKEKTGRGTVVGIGDDAAVVEITNYKSQITNNTKNFKFKRYLLITTDTLIENVHFKLKDASFFDLGYKSLAVNISDIAAMGGYPTHALVTIGLPPNLEVKSIKELYRGINALAKKHQIDIVGGDTVSSPKGIIVSITLLGEVEKKYLLLRSGAKVGDLICVTGKFGGPAANKFKVQKSKVKIRIIESRKIAKSRIATAMIDSSDGLVRSVIEICKASKEGAKIFENKVPKAKGATLDQALYGGEEYELVFTVPPERIRRLRIKHYVVGEIADKKTGVKLVDKNGKIKRLKSGGFDHFKHA